MLVHIKSASLLIDIHCGSLFETDVATCDVHGGARAHILFADLCPSMVISRFHLASRLVQVDINRVSNRCLV